MSEEHGEGFLVESLEMLRAGDLIPAGVNQPMDSDVGVKQLVDGARVTSVPHLVEPAVEDGVSGTGHNVTSSESRPLNFLPIRYLIMRSLKGFRGLTPGITRTPEITPCNRRESQVCVGRVLGGRGVNAYRGVGPVVVRRGLKGPLRAAVWTPAQGCISPTPAALPLPSIAGGAGVFRGVPSPRHHPRTR